jgi:uncharacterized protein with HEPN domain
MDNYIKTCLGDVLQSIQEIESYFEGQPKVFAEYRNDGRTRRAVERNIEIIGEAVNRILKFNPEFKLENARNIIGTRNRIIHSYDAISDELIWSIIINHLPLLKIEVMELLKEK